LCGANSGNFHEKQPINVYNIDVKGKGKVVPALLTVHHAMKAYWGMEA
jgi:hypothetical protein